MVENYPRHAYLQNPKRQSTLALEFFNRMIAHADLNQPKCLKFAVNLWNLVQMNANADTQKFAVNTLRIDDRFGYIALV